MVNVDRDSCQWRNGDDQYLIGSTNGLRIEPKLIESICIGAKINTEDHFGRVCLDGTLGTHRSSTSIHPCFALSNGFRGRMLGAFCCISLLELS